MIPNEYQGFFVTARSVNRCEYVHHINLKGALCCFGEEIQTQNFNIYNINEATIQTHKY